ncbi:MAG: hypothetical protein AB7P24_21275 [Nitrospira sp.]
MLSTLPEVLSVGKPYVFGSTDDEQPLLNHPLARIPPPLPCLSSPLPVRISPVTVKPHILRICMEPSFWHNRWQTNQTRWHESTVNPLLIAHFPSLNVAPDGCVFLPFCGKSLDLGWFLACGYAVAAASAMQGGPEPQDIVRGTDDRPSSPAPCPIIPMLLTHIPPPNDYGTFRSSSSSHRLATNL